MPRKVLKDRYDSPEESDEPIQIEMENDKDDLYDEDQFYRESEAIPPAPKLQSGMTKDQRPSDTTFLYATSSIEPPAKSRDSNNLEGIVLFILFALSYYICSCVNCFNVLIVLTFVE